MREGKAGFSSRKWVELDAVQPQLLGKWGGKVSNYKQLLRKAFGVDEIYLCVGVSFALLGNRRDL